MIVMNSQERRFDNNDDGMNSIVLIRQYNNTFKRTMRITFILLFYVNTTC